ncbi:MAG: hypothetical protein UW06_C0011G0005 [Parcubacteria group bacterium GW2011_GWE1_43_8]|nr:MAG: hypothetical protein UW06_C0011G0005 [Parcubacteria group bacterium GW2011_GWE1_43_8]
MVEWGGLENRYTSNGIGGSNPPASALYGISKTCIAERLSEVRIPPSPPRQFFIGLTQIHSYKHFMKNFYPKLDKKTGRFLPIPLGKKPQKMKDMEKVLHVKFEKDYKDFYLSEKMGQKLFARRWGASSKNLIFAKNLRGHRRSWVQMLDLPSRDKKFLNNKPKIVGSYCELCGEKDCSLDKAHWVENAEKGSSKSFNILNLCPNCHRKLDRGDNLVTQNAKAILLTRETRKLINSEKDEKLLRQHLVELCEKILGARR